MPFARNFGELTSLSGIPPSPPWVGILPLPDGLAINAMGDGYRMDKFFRFNESLQRFFDLSASIDTTFAVASPA